MKRLPPWRSAAFRMALHYSVLLVLSILVLFVVFYFQTVAILQERIDRQIVSNTRRLTADHVQYGQAFLVTQIRALLRDDMHSDTEIYLFVDAAGKKVIGNISTIPAFLHNKQGLVEGRVVRNGREIQGRMLQEMLPDGSRLVVGSDTHHQREIEYLFHRAGWIAGLIGILMSIGGSFLFHHQLKQRMRGIKQLAERIKTGDMKYRIAPSLHQDEFSLLNADINEMLDKQQRLMEGVRHVSNTIAHNLRTPLTRILLHLRKSQGEDEAARAHAIAFALHEIEEVGVMFDKLLDIAEVESGTYRQAFAPVAVNDVMADVLEFYEPVAAENSSTLTVQTEGEPVLHGDRELLVSAVANLVDNALKYAGQHAAVTLSCVTHDRETVIIVRDNGCGIAPHELSKIGTHFYRLDRSRTGYGLGMASVMAIVRLHGGHLEFDDAAPGLIVRMVFKKV